MRELNQITEKNPLEKTAETGLTDVWIDSCCEEAMRYAIGNGAVGVTTNPVIVGQVLKIERHLWEDRINELIAENPEGSEEKATWKLIEEMAVKGAGLLEGIFKREQGKKGRICIQTNPKDYRNTALMVEQALHFDSLAPNMQVKIPVTKAGLAAIEEATFRGVNINGTVSFTVSQAIAVAEAVESGLKRREEAGRDISKMAPVCTIMVGRVDDWLKIVADKNDIIADPCCFEWAGVAVMKKAYEIYRQRGYKTRLLSAAYRNHLHWSEFIGGDAIVSIPYKWQKRFNNSDVEIISRMGNPVDPSIIKELSEKFEDFNRAYDENGLTVEEFDTYGATVRTLRSFIGGYEELMGEIRDMMLPNPDIS